MSSRTNSTRYSIALTKRPLGTRLADCLALKTKSSTSIITTATANQKEYWVKPTVLRSPTIGVDLKPETSSLTSPLRLSSGFTYVPSFRVRPLRRVSGLPGPYSLHRPKEQEGRNHGTSEHQDLLACSRIDCEQGQGKQQERRDDARQTGRHVHPCTLFERSLEEKCRKSASDEADDGPSRYGRQLIHALAPSSKELSKTVRVR